MSRVTKRDRETLPTDKFSQSYDLTDLHSMRSIPKSPTQVDDVLHPLWLGILILFHAIALIVLLYCLRRRCGSRLHASANRTNTRNAETSLSDKEDARQHEKIHSIAESRHSQVESVTHVFADFIRTRPPIGSSLVNHHV